MDSAIKNTSFKARPMSELMSELHMGVCNAQSFQLQTQSTKKNPRPTMVQPHTTEKPKIYTIEQLRPQLLVFGSPMSKPKAATSVKKVRWDNSAKVVNKSKSYIANEPKKLNLVRKMLTFQPKQQPQDTRKTISNRNLKSETPTFQKPEPKVKKSIMAQSKYSVRMSGINEISETPTITSKIVKNKFTMHHNVNKIKNTQLPNCPKKNVTTPKHTKMRLIPDTPLSNMSFKSNGDASFLKNEKEINDREEKNRALTSIENIAKVSPPVSTPFKEYRSIQDFFNETNENENSAYYDDTVTSFDKPAEDKENRDESAIGSLCDMFNKATVNSTIVKPELNDLIKFQEGIERKIKIVESNIETLKNIKQLQLKSVQEFEKVTEKNIEIIDSKIETMLQLNSLEEFKKETKGNINMIDSKIETLISFKETQHKSLQDVKKLINSKTILKKDNLNDEIKVVKENVSIVRPSVVKNKSPSYKIYKKNLSLRSKVHFKSLANGQITPEQDKALDMYMKMKKNMNFLNTPQVKQQNKDIVNTPTVTSINLQMQLNKLYNES